ncbi:extracellular solute-binding protein [Allofournierella sp.]|uniref:extracellular solute-binding protein n=1 Tax=Allofournierella sp. TaxID=1940256 RepID=UPI003AB7D12A
MKKANRFLALGLSVAMAAGLLAGCGGAGPTPAGSAADPASGTDAGSKAPVEVSIAIWGVEEALSNPDDPVLKQIEEKTGVKLVPQNVTWDDSEQKIQLWATNGQLPDIFAGDFVAKSFYGNWIEQGVIRALPEDLSAYPNLAEHMQMERAQAAARDGKLYMIPRTTYGDISYSVLDRNVVYRWDLAQAAGVTKEPETYEEFADMIKRIVAADPEGKHISGMTQALPELIGGFVYPYAGIIDKKWVADASGKFAPSYFADRDALVSAMQFARDMYTEGVIEKDIALAKLETSKEKYLQGQSAAMVFAWSGPAGLESNIGRDYDELYGAGSFLENNRIAKLYPSADGNRYYFVDTESWSESYISAKVDDEKMAAICRLFDYLYSEEGSRLVFCGFEGEDYDVKDGKVVMREGVNPTEKYTYCNSNSNLTSLAMWNPESWDTSFPSAISPAYRALNEARHEDAVKNGTLPAYYDGVLFLSTPLKDAFTYSTNDDLLQIMMGTDPVEKMVDDLLASYEGKGLSAMLDEVNAKAAELGIKAK